MNLNEYIEFVLEKLISFYKPEKIYLFGSQARKDADQNSDIDFLLVTETNKPKKKRAIDFRKELRGKNEYPLDIMVYTPEEFNEWCDVINTIPYRVKEEGELLYERKKSEIIS